MIDARADAGVPCITTLPDPEPARFAEATSGVPLEPWQRWLINGLMSARVSAPGQAAH